MKEPTGDDEARAPALPQQIGPYRVLERIGEGGMGIVYVADQLEPVRRRVALKVIRADRDGKRYQARFEMERKALERMDHPNVARIFDAGVTADGKPYFAMELVRGVGLTEYCDTRKLTLSDRLRLFRQVCDGVQHAHMKGILHRDLKPSNILVTEVDDRPVVKIIDFGLARAVDIHGQRPTLFEELRRIIGTIAYMSPEQAGLTPEDVDTRTDVYSLGVILYELATGQLPFAVDELEQLPQLVLPQYLREQDPEKPSTRLSGLGQAITDIAALRGTVPQRLRAAVSGELDWVTMRALEKLPARRYASALDLGREIDRVLAHQPVEAGPPSTWYRLQKWVVRHRLEVAAGSVVVVSVLAAVAWSFASYRAELQARADALVEAQRRVLAGDPSVLADLERRQENDLWPAVPDKIAALQLWLQEAQELAGRMAEHAVELQRLEQASDPVGTRLAMRRRQFVDALGPFLHEQLPAIERRVRLAESLVAQSIKGPDVAAAWQSTLERLQQDHRFSAIKPQLGLVPLGPDPTSHLEEFAVVQSGTTLRRQPDGKLTTSEEMAIVLVLLPGGTIDIGARKDQGPNQDPNAQKREGPVQTIRLEPFFLSKYEMTQSQWIRVMYSNPSNFQPNQRWQDALREGITNLLPTLCNPVDIVSCTEAAEALRRLSLELPTEAQWEYGCRAGTHTPWSCDIADLGRSANLYDTTAFGHAVDKTRPHAEFVDGHVFTAPVGSLLPNAFGLHDMHGNVWEWCRDPYEDFNYAKGQDPITGEFRGDSRQAVLRGGSYLTLPNDARSSNRQPFWRRGVNVGWGARPARRIEGQ